jgi:hypothetical protein
MLVFRLCCAVGTLRCQRSEYRANKAQARKAQRYLGRDLLEARQRCK